MKILFVINSGKFAYHNILYSDLAEEFRNFWTDRTGDAVELFCVDMNQINTQGKALYELFYEIQDVNADLIVTLDCAGFELRTEGDGLSLNILPSRMIHILCGRKEMFREELSLRQNFSMFLCSMAGESFGEHIPNVCDFPKVMYKSADAADRMSNREAVREWLPKIAQRMRFL